MRTQALLEAGATILLGLDLAAAYVTGFIWDPTSEWQLLIHLVIVFLVSLLFGALVADMKKTLFHLIASIILGVSLAIFIITSPALIFATNAALVDATLTVALVGVARLFMVGVTFIMLGAFAGNFVGEMLGVESGT